MKKLFVLICETGEYSERNVSVIAIYENEADAQVAVVEATQYSAEQTALRDAYQETVISPWWENFWIKQKKSDDEYQRESDKFHERFPDTVRLRSSPQRGFNSELAATAPKVFEGTAHPIYGLDYGASYYIEEVPLIDGGRS